MTLRAHIIAVPFLILVLISHFPIFAGICVVPTVSAQNGEVETLICYFHNDTSTPYVNGYQTFFIMNTSQPWSESPATVKSKHKITQYWYLYPTLEADCVIKGFSLGIWVNASGVEPQGVPTVKLFELDESGKETEVSSYTFGSKQLFNAPTYLNLTVPDSLDLNFKKGSSIKLYFELVVGAAVYGQLWFGTSSFDSNLVLKGIFDGGDSSVGSAPLWFTPSFWLIVILIIIAVLGIAYTMYKKGMIFEGKNL